MDDKSESDEIDQLVSGSRRAIIVDTSNEQLEDTMNNLLEKSNDQIANSERIEEYDISSEQSNQNAEDDLWIQGMNSQSIDTDIGNIINSSVMKEGTDQELGFANDAESQKSDFEGIEEGEVFDKQSLYSDELSNIDEISPNNGQTEADPSVIHAANTNNNQTDSMAEVTSTDITNVHKKNPKHPERYYIEDRNAMTVQVTTDCGTCMEFCGVPNQYYASEVIVLINRDTGIRQNYISLVHNGEPVKPMKRVRELTDDDDVVRLQLKSERVDLDYSRIRLGKREVTFKSGLTIRINCRKKFVPTGNCKREDVLQTQTIKGGIMKSQKVHIDWLPENHHKPFLGGYRHKITDTKYHHAYAQSKQLPQPQRHTEVYSRETQTYRMKHFGQSTIEEMSTQFSKPGLYVSNSKDQLRIPGPYETAEEYMARVLRDVIIIQKYTRRWLAKRRVNKLRQIRDVYLEWIRQHEEKLKKDRDAQLKRDFERRLHPRTQSDFDRLFNALEQWKREEIAKINAKPYCVAERKAALALLLDDETELIGAIGRHQLCAAQRTGINSQINVLRKAAAPIKWTSAINGRALEVETPQTLRAKTLLDILISLRLESLTPEERLDILLTTKKTISQYTYKVCNELVKLIDREAELIVRKVAPEQIKGLRQRIVNEFIKFAKIPETNPEVAKYIKVPTGSREQIAESLKGDVHYCLSCDRYLRNTAFPLSARANRLAPCESCRRLDNRARKRMDLDPYRRMLLELRKREVELIETARQIANEETREAELQSLERGERPKPVVKIDGTDFNVLNANPFPYLVNEEDIRFLVDDVWERRSILSGWLDIMDLVITRWRLSEPWSPWNMILVTREEAEAHEKLETFSLELTYADPILNTVNQRLVMGRNAFPRLRKNGIRMAHDEVILTQRLQNIENTQEWLTEKRQRLPPLNKQHGLLEYNEERHRPIYQPPEYMLPAIRGEQRLSEVQPR